ncbi:MAG TPA: hypothetical protein VMU55_05160 [Solirubrobacteraceae bacterium]|nr:hypothetical protein [Solirubrobacteraceae bacterium]
MSDPHPWTQSEITEHEREASDDDLQSTLDNEAEEDYDPSMGDCK